MTGRVTKQDIIKAFRSGPIIAVILGLVMFMLNIRLPHVIGSTVNFIADLNTPLAMIVTGVYIAKTNILKAFTQIGIYKVAIIKLLIVPAVMIIIFMFINPNSYVKDIAIANLLSSACPTAAATLFMATKYDSKPQYASMLVATTTLLSIITLPLLMYILEKSMGIFYNFFI